MKDERTSASRARTKGRPSLPKRNDALRRATSKNPVWRAGPSLHSKVAQKPLSIPDRTLHPYLNSPVPQIEISRRPPQQTSIVPRSSKRIWSCNRVAHAFASETADAPHASAPSVEGPSRPVLVNQARLLNILRAEKRAGRCRGFAEQPMVAFGREWASRHVTAP